MVHSEADNRLVFKGFEAWVVAGPDNKLLPQFGVECEETKLETSAWIPSEAGQTFAVRYRKVRRDRHALKAQLFLDGNKADSGVNTKNTKSGVSSVKTISCIEISPTATMDLMFNSAVLTDDDTFLDHSLSAGIGEIRLVLQPVEVIRRTPPKDVHLLENFSIKLPEIPKIHERAKKGLVHQVQFSDEIKTKRASNRVKTKNMGSPVTFIFKYRSMDVLQANGIAPRPTPAMELKEDSLIPRVSTTNSERATPNRETSNVKQEDEIDELEDDVDDEIIAKERALLAALEEVQNLKRARKDGGRPPKRVKTELVSSFVPGEVIDLTEPPRVKREPANHFVDGEVIDLT